MKRNLEGRGKKLFEFVEKKKLIAKQNVVKWELETNYNEQSRK